MKSKTKFEQTLKKTKKHSIVDNAILRKIMKVFYQVSSFPNIICISMYNKILQHRPRTLQLRNCSQKYMNACTHSIYQKLSSCIPFWSNYNFFNFKEKILFNKNFKFLIVWGNNHYITNKRNLRYFIERQLVQPTVKLLW